jgi:ubiquinol-cytochrome c reductase iron-sulfur subunit
MQRRSVLAAATAAVGAWATWLAAIPLVGSLAPSAKARALGSPIEVDLAALRPGEVRPFMYRGRTMLVLRRTEEMLGKLSAMRDRAFDDRTDPDRPPEPSYADNEQRSRNPEFLVIEGVCPHLGCVPRLKNAANGRELVGDWWQGGFICPCHTSAYDYAGRVVRGPAPYDLPVPPHHYLTPTRIIIGEEGPTS